MKKLITPLVLFLILQHAIPVAAQPKAVTINGRVTSFEESLPLEGVTIRVKESTNSTGTQADGIFSLSIAPGEKTLLVDLRGYEKKEIFITKATEYKVVLKRPTTLALAFQNKCKKDKVTVNKK